MRRLLATAALLLVMAAAIPACSDDAADCSNTGVAACRRLADQGKAAAQYILGVMYQRGQGVPQDYAEAMKWYRKAADQGLPVAQSNLGTMYENGWGVRKDEAAAVRWYQKAADQGL